MNSVRLLVYLLVNEFRYQDYLLTRKCHVCRQLVNVRELFMNNALSKTELKIQDFKILHIFQRHHTEQLMRFQKYTQILPLRDGPYQH